MFAYICLIGFFCFSTAKLNAAKSIQSIVEKENIHILNSTENLSEKRKLSETSLKNSFNSSNELIATTNSKGDVVAKRPDKLNISMNMNKKLTEEIEATFKNRENHNAESMETVKLEDDCVKEMNGDDSDKDNAGSPFYADPVDTLKEVSGHLKSIADSPHISFVRLGI